MIGQTLGHYKIVDKLGAGGMGEVYRAIDTTLDREVAFKVLPPGLTQSQERLDRFEREAKALAALVHPNIVHIYTIEEANGTRFLTMELIDGKPLLELIPPNGMALEQIFKIATPMADALASAHEKGIIHRDLKPANVMVTNDGRVKVLDFGLAKLSHDAAPISTELATEPLTRDGLILGTMPYMSPEQLQGKELDGRSDVFSLGVMLYEMATGERPFKGDTSATLIMSIGRDTAPEVDTVRTELPHHLGRVIGRCLEKDPEERFQSVKDVRNEFKALQKETDSRAISASHAVVPPRQTVQREWRPVIVAVGLAVAAGALWFLLRGRQSESNPETAAVETESTESPRSASTETDPGAASDNRKMIVVLPFENLGSPEDDYFAAGMTEEITSRLGVVSGMGVISRTSATQYDRQGKTMNEIGNDLGVEYVLEGTVRWAKDGDSSRIRITPQLIQVSDDTHLWADTYDRVIDDVFAIQSEIAESVITELGVNLLDSERQSLAVKLTDNPAAYQAYLQGWEIWNRATVDWIATAHRATKLFDKAVELDPTFVRAWTSISRAKAFEHFNVGTEPDLVLDSKAALDRATELAPDNPYVGLATGYYHYYGLRDFDRALQEFEAIATELPNDAEVLTAMGAILRRKGRIEESISTMERVLVLDPQNGQNWMNIAETYRSQRRFDDAFRSLDRVIALTPGNADSYVTKAKFMLDTGNLDVARKVLSQAPVTDPMLEAWFWQEFYDRNFDAALEHALLLPRPDPVARLYADWLRCMALSQLDRADEAREVLQEGAREAEALVDAGSIYAGFFLGTFYAHLDRKEDAIRAAEQYIELHASDFWMKGAAEENLAFIYTYLGDPEAAVEFFDRLLTTPYWLAITIEMLRLDPRLDPIRDDPRFQAMLEKYGQESG